MINEQSEIVERIVLESDMSSIHRVEDLVDRVSDTGALSEDMYGNVLIAVTEALNNAIVHGNLSHKEKAVVVDCVLNGKGLMVAVADQGDGFDYDNLPDPTAPENIEKPNGRGVFLMKSLADDVVFEDGGRKVTLFFNR
jgi:serine/threonine-protein kinase RsbW